MPTVHYKVKAARDPEIATMLNYPVLHDTKLPIPYQHCHMCRLRTLSTPNNSYTQRYESHVHMYTPPTKQPTHPYLDNVNIINLVLILV